MVTSKFPHSPKGRSRNHALLHSLHERGLSAEKIAAAIFSSRAHVCLVLRNTPGRGHQTRRKIAPLLTERERALLGWTAQGALFPVECSNP